MLRKISKWGGLLIVILGLWICILLAAVAVVKHRVPVSLPFARLSAIAGTVTTNGTWVIEGQEQGFPLQTTAIKCEKEPMRCAASTAMLVSGDYLSTDIDFYEVVSWENSHIVFVDDSPLCTSYVFTIDLATKSTNAIRRKKNSEIEQCAAVRHEELRMSLKDGFETERKLREEAYPWFGKLARAPLNLF